jgi:hypothetical protein
MYSEEINVYRKAAGLRDPLYGTDDVYFNQQLLENGLDYASDKNIFRFYHLSDVHPPYSYRMYNGNIEKNSGR